MKISKCRLNLFFNSDKYPFFHFLIQIHTWWDFASLSFEKNKYLNFKTVPWHLNVKTVPWALEVHEPYIRQQSEGFNFLPASFRDGENEAGRLPMVRTRLRARPARLVTPDGVEGATLLATLQRIARFLRTGCSTSSDLLTPVSRDRAQLNLTNM